VNVPAAETFAIIQTKFEQVGSQKPINTGYFAELRISILKGTFSHD
jgi:N-methylhydantoinase B/oxoprolinase/acetone carboxylase alpha subunit